MQWLWQKEQKHYLTAQASLYLKPAGESSKFYWTDDPWMKFRAGKEKHRIQKWNYLVWENIHEGISKEEDMESCGVRGKKERLWRLFVNWMKEIKLYP